MEAAQVWVVVPEEAVLLAAPVAPVPIPAVDAAAATSVPPRFLSSYGCMSSHSHPGIISRGIIVLRFFTNA